MAQLSIGDITVDPATAQAALQLQLNNFAAPIEPTPMPPNSGFPFNTIAVRVLRKRVADARDTFQAKNISVSADLLIELLNGSEHGMKYGFVSTHQV